MNIPSAFDEINKISHYLPGIGSRLLIDGSGELIATCANDAVLYRSSTAKIDALDGKELVFTIEVTCGDAVVSEGTHQRFVVGG